VNLAPATRYGYRVKARDLSASLNETDWSPWKYATTGAGTDTIAPTPNPAQFDPNGLPREYSGGGGDLDYFVEMMAVTATDDSGGAVQYKFVCSDDRYSSGWQDSNIWRIIIGNSNRGWTWRVITRDASANETIPSVEVQQKSRPEQAALGTGATGG
jgi:hypothetical protein